jgi:O-Antigen ligase
MKWIFLLAMLGGIPVLAGWLRENRHRAHYVWVLLGFLPFFIGPWHLMSAPISWPLWPGFVKGMEITALDAVALAIIFSKPPNRYSVPFKGTFLLYIFTAAIAVPHATVPVAASFYVWQLLRIFLVFVAVAMVAASDRGVISIISGMVLGITIQAGYALEARIGGALQTGGSLGHQNLLGFISHLVILPSFALILMNRHVKIGICGLVFGALAVILTASRGSIGFAALGLVLVYLFSVLRGPTGRKGSLGILFAVGMLAAYPFAQSSLQRRFDATVIARAEAGDYDERAAFERAAKFIIDDHPLGVGPNMYVTTANTGGYSQRAGVVWNAGSRSANVHNAYLLINAETGYPGIAAFLLLLGGALFTAFTTIWRYRADPRSDLLIAVGSGVAMIALHSFFEWAFVIYPAQYIFAIALGLIAGLRHQLGVSANQTQKVEARRPQLVRTPKLQQAKRLMSEDQ